MKINRKNLNRLALLLLVAAASLPACRKDAKEIISETEAAEIIETAVADRTAGLTMPTVDMAELLSTLLDQCGVPGDTSYTISRNIGPAGCNYNLELDWLVNCNNLNIPIDAAFNTAGNGTFTSTRWNGDNQSAGAIAFTGLSLQETAYIANGSYNLTGSVTGNLRHADPTMSCNLAMNLSDLAIQKSDYSVSGGGATFTLAVSLPNGESQQYSGDIVFNGDGTATVTIGGHSHDINL